MGLWTVPKLPSIDTIRRIKLRYAQDGITYKELGKLYGYSASAIGNYIKYDLSHIKEEINKLKCNIK